MNKGLSLVVTLFFAVAAHSQQAIIDSLHKQLATDLPDTVRVLSMMRVAVNYEGLDTMKSAKAYRDAIAFARSKNMEYQAGVIYQNFHFLMRNRGLYAEAEKYLDSALFFVQKFNTIKAKESLGMIYNSFGSIENYKGNYQKAIEYFRRSVKVTEEIGRHDRLIIPLLNISALYKEMNDFEKQEEYARKALISAQKTGAKEQYFMPYTYLVFALTRQNKFEAAKPLLDSSKLYYRANAPYEALVSYHLVACLLYMNLNMLDSAEKSARESLAIAEKYQAVFSINQSRMQLGRVLTLQKKYSEAEPMLLSALDEIKKTKEPEQFVVVYEYLSNFYEESGNYKQAVQFYKAFKAADDSISSEQNKKYYGELEVKYETEKMENRIKLQESALERKNIFNYILIGGTATLLVILLLSYRNYRQKQQFQQQRIHKLETEKQLAATEAVLKGEEQERARLAKDLHDGLGGMLSGIKYSLNTMKGNIIMTPENVQAFERSIDMLDSSIKEMRRVAHNLMPETLMKFGLDITLRDFCNDIHQSGALKVTYQSVGMEGKEPEQTTSITIFRIVQELLNNVLKHAAAKHAIVQLHQTDGLLAVTVEDDGKGFDVSALHTVKGIGWENIRNRVEFLKGKLDISSNPGSGTSVHIELPS